MLGNVSSTATVLLERDRSRGRARAYPPTSLCLPFALLTVTCLAWCGPVDFTEHTARHIRHDRTINMRGRRDLHGERLQGKQPICDILPVVASEKPMAKRALTMCSAPPYSKKAVSAATEAGSGPSTAAHASTFAPTAQTAAAGTRTYQFTVHVCAALLNEHIHQSIYLLRRSEAIADFHGTPSAVDAHRLRWIAQHLEIVHFQSEQTCPLRALLLERPQLIPAPRGNTATSAKHEQRPGPRENRCCRIQLRLRQVWSGTRTRALRSSGGFATVNYGTPGSE